MPFKFKHFDMVLELHRSQKYLGIEHITMKTLPKIGFVAVMGNQPIACGFLRRLEGGYAQIDTLASNAYFGSQIRNDGVKAVVDELINESKHLKLHGLIAITKDSGTLMRAQALGFHIVEHSVLALPLQE